MKIIGLGLPRTASLTMKQALEMLGFGPCYHMTEVLPSTDRMPGWIDAFNGKPDWDAIFRGYPAILDWPAAHYYRELAEHYPDAKFLLSVRDGTSWVRSMRSTIWQMMYSDEPMHYLWEAHARLDPVRKEFWETITAMFDESGMFGPDPRNIDEKAMIAGMERRNEAVRQLIPKEQLLEWRPADGWEPLCGFLQVPVPAAPLPNANDTAAFGAMINGACLHGLNEWYAQQSAPTK
jgi:hypothetical protein